jgi:hypothetical protein
MRTLIRVIPGQHGSFRYLVECILSDVRISFFLYVFYLLTGDNELALQEPHYMNSKNLLIFLDSSICMYI